MIGDLTDLCHVRQSRFNSLPFEERCEQSLRLLTDMELMAHADYFVGAVHLPDQRHRHACHLHLLPHSLTRATAATWAGGRQAHGAC